LRQVLALLTAAELSEFDHLLQIMAERLPAAFPSSASTQGGTHLDSGTPPTNPARDAGGGPA
jgi:hypothetical protein